MMKQIQKGFTLIELMIVVAIIGILAAVAIPAYQDYVVKAKLSRVQSTLDPLKLALGLYFQEQGSFPTGSITGDTASADTPNNYWGSIGIKAGEKPNVPNEVEVLTVTSVDSTSGADDGAVDLTMKLRGIKADGIDGKNLVLHGEPGGTAISWTCKSTTTVTDKIATKYFGCP